MSENRRLIGLVNEMRGTDPAKNPGVEVSVKMTGRPLVSVVLAIETLMFPAPCKSASPTCRVTTLGRV